MSGTSFRLIVAMCAILAGLTLAADVQAESVVVSRRVLNATPQSYTVGTQRYTIPSNYYPPMSGKVRSHLGFKAFAPHVTGLTGEHVPCLDRRNPCHDREIIVGIDAGEIAPGMLDRIRSFTFAGLRDGPCGFKYYESTGHPAARHAFFVIRAADASQAAILRCQKHGNEYKGCSSRDNIGDGNQFYFVIAASRLCDWPDIRRKILDRISSFREVARTMPTNSTSERRPQ